MTCETVTAGAASFSGNGIEYMAGNMLCRRRNDFEVLEVVQAGMIHKVNNFIGLFIENPEIHDHAFRIKFR